MNEINFLPQSYRSYLHTRVRRVREGALVLVCALGLCAYWAYGLSDVLALQRAAEQAEDQLAGALGREAQVGVLREQKQRLGEARRVQRELRVPIRHFEVLNVLGSLMPEPVALTELVFENKRPAPQPYIDPDDPVKKLSKPVFTTGQPAPKAEPDLMEVTLEGLAPDDLSVAELIASLSGHPVFREVKLRSSRFMDTRGVAARHFRISAQVDLSRDYLFKDAETPMASAEADQTLTEVNDETHP